MRLIDADEVLKHKYEPEGCLYEAVAVDYILDAPTVDAVPVIRCSECRYWERFNNTSLGTCYHGIYAGSNLGTPENHFCASAARMDGSEGE